MMQFAAANDDTGRRSGGGAGLYRNPRHSGPLPQLQGGRTDLGADAGAP